MYPPILDLPYMYLYTARICSLIQSLITTTTAKNPANLVNWHPVSLTVPNFADFLATIK